VAYSAGGQTARAIGTIEKALRGAAALPQWHRDLGTMCVTAERWNRAETAFERYLESQPSDIAARSLYAEALFSSGQVDRALAELLDCLQREPGNAAAHNLLARLYHSRSQYENELRHRQALVPNRADADADRLSHLAAAYWHTGQLQPALDCFRESIAREPNSATYSSLLIATLHDDSQTASTLRVAHETGASLYAAGARIRHAYPNTPDPARRLRIGYLSGEFIGVPAYHLIFPLIEHADSRHFVTFCYHTRPPFNAATRQYAAAAHYWRDVRGRDAQWISRQIRRDAIDILVDFSGHFPYNALDVFARRPAPLSIAFPNYPCTTGLPAIDFILTDHWVCPPGSEAQYTEQVHRLPSGYLRYRAPENPPPVAPLPALTHGYATFGLFQRPAKMNAHCWDLAAAVLRAVPDSRLLIHYSSADLDSESSAARDRALAELACRGVEPHRVRFRGPLCHADHLALHAEIDIALDTFPYNGQTTTAECLWMGVPVVTEMGSTHVSLVGFEILDRLNLGDWVAHTPQQYVEIAVRAASDPARLARLRESLRPQVAASTLSNGRLLAREVEWAYRTLWKSWCREHIRAAHGVATRRTFVSSP
jgi:predicted O-linked N-acetylglucosamine transferase (SPINDLY family)